MSDDFLSRWSRRKHAVRRGEAPESDSLAPAQGNAAPKVPAAQADAPAAPEPLPPVESLTPDSDFTPFMREGVDPDVKQQALRTLFRDPRFNVMDGLDVYIDDYSKPDPIPADWLGKLNQLARLGDYAAAQEAEKDRKALGSRAEEVPKDAQEQPLATPAAIEADARDEPPSPPPQLQQS